MCQCGKINPDDHRFCGGCGSPFHNSMQEAPLAVQCSDASRRYLGRRPRFKRIVIIVAGLVLACAVVTGVFVFGVGRSTPNGASGPKSTAGVSLADKASIVRLMILAELGDVQSQSDLGDAYYRGEGVPKGAAQAVVWYRKAAVKGSPGGQNGLGNAYYYGQGVPRSAVQAIRWYRQAAEQGFARAQINLGVAYYYGQGVPRSAVQAIRWYRKAADQGYAGAQFALGAAYFNGEGVPKDVNEAVVWLRKAAEQGYAVAQCDLGFAYSNGEGVPKDAGQAVGWYRKAAEQGYALAQYDLGAAYSNGEGVPKDSAQAVAWVRKAAEQGDPTAQLALGTAYYNGGGVPKDAVQAVAWFRQAAEQGEVDAEKWLGDAYYNGDGAPKDVPQAVSWYRKAAEQGNSDASAALTRIDAASEKFKNVSTEELLDEKRGANESLRIDEAFLSASSFAGRARIYCRYVFIATPIGTRTLDVLETQYTRIMESEPHTREEEMERQRTLAAWRWMMVGAYKNVEICQSPMANVVPTDEAMRQHSDKTRTLLASIDQELALRKH